MARAITIAANQLVVGDQILNDINLTGTVTHFDHLNSYYICVSVNKSPGIMVAGNTLVRILERPNNGNSP